MAYVEVNYLPDKSRMNRHSRLPEADVHPYTFASSTHACARRIYTHTSGGVILGSTVESCHHAMHLARIKIRTFIRTQEHTGYILGSKVPPELTVAPPRAGKSVSWLKLPEIPSTCLDR